MTASVWSTDTGQIPWDVDNGWYRDALDALRAGDIDWDTDDIKVMLCTSLYRLDEQHRFRSDITHEIEGIGYERGGALLAQKTTTMDIDGVKVLDASDVRWLASTFTADRAVVYKDTGDPETSPLICCIRFDGAPRPVYGTFTMSWATSGIVRIPPEDTDKD